MNPRVVNVEPLEGYRLKLLFSNGENGLFDCSSLLDFGVFQELKNVDYFCQVKVIDGTVVWPNEQDICPDTIYLDAMNKTQEKKYA